jgi:hypothetical protein
VTRNLAPTAQGDAAPAVAKPMRMARVTGKLSFSGHPMLAHFAFLAAHTAPRK